MELNRGPTTWVYWNRTRRTWSVRAAGRLVARMTDVTLRDCRFKVWTGGYKRFKRTGKRTVHAFVVGHACLASADRTVNPIRVRYDPSQRPEFIDDSGRALWGAAEVRFAVVTTADGRRCALLSAYGPVYETDRA